MENKKNENKQPVLNQITEAVQKKFIKDGQGREGENNETLDHKY